MMVSCVCFTFLASEAFGLTVSIGVSPSTLNLGSSGTPITCSVWLPPGYDADDVESVTLEGISPYSTSSTGNTLTCKFDRATFEAMLAPYAPGEVTLTLTGTLVDGVSIEGTDTNVTASLSVTANFDAIEYVVVGTSGPNGSIDPEAATVNYGNDVAFTATPAIGYQVDEWSVDGTVVQTGGTSYTLGNVQADQTVSVTFGATTYVINSWADPGGSISPAGDTEVKPGDDLTLTAIPNAGYRIDRWFLDGNVVQIGKTTYKIRPKADHNPLVRLTSMTKGNLRKVSPTTTRTRRMRLWCSSSRSVLGRTRITLRWCCRTRRIVKENRSMREQKARLSRPAPTKS